MPNPDYSNIVNYQEGCEEVPKGATDNGRMWIAAAWDIAAAALAAVNAVTSSTIAGKQLDLAYRYFQLSKNWKDWYDQGFVPLENKELDEVWAEELPEPHYDAAIGRASNHAKLKFANVLKQAMRCTTQYDSGLRGWIVKEAVRSLGGDIASFQAGGYMNERSRIEIESLRRWKRREAAVMRGRRMAAGNVAYSELAAGIYNDLGAQAGAAMGSFMNTIGMGHRLSSWLSDLKTLQTSRREARERPEFGDVGMTKIMQDWSADWSWDWKRPSPLDERYETIRML